MKAHPAVVEATMATLTLIGGSPPNYVPVRAHPPAEAPGDGFLLVERPLINPKTSQQVGRLIARVTWMDLPASGDTLYFGNADHHLDRTKKKGVISVQGSWRESETKSVFAIIGGTGDYKFARGTVTYVHLITQFTYDVN
jgi:Dirigent-like protein